MESFVLHVLKLNIIAAVVILLVKVFSLFLEKKFTAQWKYLIWLVIALSLLIPVRLPSELSLFHFQVKVEDTGGKSNAAVQSAVPDHGDTNQDAVSDNRETVHSAASAAQDGGRSYGPLVFKMVFLVWMAVAVLRILCAIVGYTVSTGRLRRMSIPVYNSFTQKAYHAVCRSKGIRNPPVLMQNAGLSTPLLTGILRTELYLPAIGYNAEELKLIFHHELAHYRRKDLWYKMLLKLCASIYWFNPFLLIMLREAENDIENLCDTHVVRSCTGNDHQLYRRLLLKTVAMQNHIPYVTASLNDSTMVFKERILYMVNLKKLRKSPLPGVVLAVLLILSNAAFSFSAAAAQSEGAAAGGPAAADKTDEQDPQEDSGASAKERELINMVNYVPEQNISDAPARENASAVDSGTFSVGEHESYGGDDWSQNESYGSGESYSNEDTGYEHEEYEEPSYTENTEEPDESDSTSGTNDPADLYSWDAGTNSFIPYQQADGEGLPIGQGEGWYYYDDASGEYQAW